MWRRRAACDFTSQSRLPPAPSSPPRPVPNPSCLARLAFLGVVAYAGPTVATAGLSMQVPIAVVLDVLFRSPAWLGSVGPAVLTFAGGALILAGFFGINLSSEQEEQERVRPGRDLACMHVLRGALGVRSWGAARRTPASGRVWRAITTGAWLSDAMGLMGRLS